MTLRQLPSFLVLVDLEAHLGIRAHHLGLAALDRLDVDVAAVPDVDHRHDVRLPLRVAADAPDQLPAQELLDLALAQLLDHRAIFTYAARAAFRDSPDLACRRARRGCQGSGSRQPADPRLLGDDEGMRARLPALPRLGDPRAAAGPADRPTRRAGCSRLAAFGRPRPVLVATGGDVLMPRRPRGARRAGRRPEDAVRARAERDAAAHRGADRVLRRLGVKIASISLDGASAAVHDGVRGVPGHFEATLAAIRLLRRHGITVQVNTVVMRDTVEELPARRAARAGARRLDLGGVLPRPGRARRSPRRADAGRERAGLPLPRRTPPATASSCARSRRRSSGGSSRSARAGMPPPDGELYARLAGRLRRELGPGTGRRGRRRRARATVAASSSSATTARSRRPASCPTGSATCATTTSSSVYREHPLLRRIRAADFGGRCGRCAYRKLCGGSRARAYAFSGDALGEDPACGFEPAV